MPKSLYILLFWSFIKFTAAGATPEHTVEASIRAIEQAPALEATFTASQPSGQLLKGTLTLCGSRFRLLSPAMSVWYDGTTQWALNHDIQEVNISEPTPQELAQTNPLRLLGALRQACTLKALPAPTGTTKILFTPRAGTQAAAEYRSVVATIRTDTSLPRQFVITDSSGTPTTIDILSAKVLRALPADTFRFPATKFPTVETVDLR